MLVSHHIFTVSCGGHRISFPIPEGTTLNITDPRNCENYFTCSSLSCEHCPCEPGQTFNPGTLRCDTTNAACVCPTIGTLPPTKPTAIIANDKAISSSASSAATATTKKTPHVDAGAGPGRLNQGDDDKKSPEGVSTEVIIIAGIVSATVIVIVVIVMAVFCWQRRQTQHK